MGKPKASRGAPLNEASGRHYYVGAGPTTHPGVIFLEVLLGVRKLAWRAFVPSWNGSMQTKSPPQS